MGKKTVSGVRQTRQRGIGRKRKRGRQRAKCGLPKLWRFEQFEPRMLLTAVNEDITTDQTWTAANSPYEIASNIAVQAGQTLTIEPGAEVILSRSLSIGGTVIADGVTFRFNSYHDLTVQGEHYGDPIGTLQATNCAFLGNPYQAADELVFDANSVVAVYNSLFDTNLYVESRSETVVLDNNTFQGANSVTVLPSLVDDLYDNAFTAAFPVTVGVSGMSSRDVTWRPFSNVGRFAVTGSGVTVTQGTRLTVQLGTEIALENALSIEGTMIADDAIFRFNSYHDLTVQGEHYGDPIGTLQATNCAFLGNPYQAADELAFDANSVVSVRNSLFDANLYVDSRSETAVLDNNTFQGANSVTVLPSLVDDLYDNVFAAAKPVTVNVAGMTSRDVTWRPFSNVSRFAIAESSVTVAQDTTLSIQPGLEVAVGNTLSVGGTLLADGTVFRFTSNHDLVVQGEHYGDPIGTLVATSCAFFGNPNQNADEVAFDANSTVVVEDSLFDANLYVSSHSETAVLAGNTFQGDSPISVVPSRVDALYGNVFSASFPVTIHVTGTTTRDVRWQPFGNVGRYAVGGSGVTVAEGTALTIDPGTEIQLDSPLSVRGSLAAAGVTFRFTSYTDLAVQGEHYGDPIGTLTATDCTFLGNAGQTGDEVRLDANSVAQFQNCLFDENIFVVSRSSDVVWDGNTFRQSTPVWILPSQVDDLYDNTFASPSSVTIQVGGTTTRDVTWLPFGNVGRYAIESGVSVAEGMTLTIEAGAEVLVASTLSVEGTLVADNVAFLFTSFNDLVVQGEHYQDPQGTLLATDCTFVGNPDQNGDSVVFERDSTVRLAGCEFGMDLALIVSGGSDVVLNGPNYFSNLELDGNYPALQFDARGVYWGTWAATTTDEQRSEIENHVYHQPDSRSRGTVLFEPWLNSPPRGYLSVTTIAPGSPTGGTRDYFDVRFDKAILARSFTIDDVSITSPAPAAQPVQVVSVEQRNAAEFRVYFDPQTGTPANRGTYHITIGSDVQDVGGTPMDGNHNGVPGEASDAYENAFRLESAQLSVSQVQVASNPLVAGRSAHVSWNVANRLVFPVLGGWTDYIYLSADAVLDASDPTIGSLVHTDAMAAGESRSFSHQPILPGILPGTDYHVFVESVLAHCDATRTGASTNGVGNLTLQVSPLAGNGLATGGQLAPGDLRDYFVLDLQAGQMARIEVPDNGIANVNLLAALERIPYYETAAERDYDYSDTRSQRAASIDIPMVTAPTRIFVQVYAPRVDRPSDYSIVSTITNVPPRVAGVSAQGVIVAPIDAVQVTFDRTMDPRSFSIPGGAVQLAGPVDEVAVESTWLSDSELLLSFVPQFSVGQYTLTLSPQIADTNGWQLDTDGDLLGGELRDDLFRTSFSLALHGDIAVDRTIPADSVLTIDGNLTVAEGATLTIEAGATLKFVNGRGLQVQGNLVTKGTPERPVVFTSLADDQHAGDTNRDGSATLPSAGNWNGITFYGTSTGDLEHSHVLYAGTAIDADHAGAEVALLGGVLAHGFYGVYTYSPYVTIVAENCLISNFSNHAVFMRADSRGTFRGCTIVDNRDGIHLGGAAMTIENSIVAGNEYRGLDHGGDPPELEIRHSLFHNPTNISWNGDPGLPDLMADGNTTAEPGFVDRAHGDYRLGPNSPAVDAGLGSASLTSDIVGSHRYDDRGVANTGTGWPSYVDMGALERTQPSPGLNLAVSAVSLSAAASVQPGDPLGITWEISNTGDVAYPAGVVDAVYLSTDPYFDATDLLLTEFTHGDALPPSRASTATWNGHVPIGAAGPMVALVITNRNPQRREAVVADNLAVGQAALSVNVPTLTLDDPQLESLARGQTQFFRFEARANRAYHFSATTANSGNLQLFVQRGVIPTSSAFAVADIAGQSTRREARLYDAEDDMYYVAVHADRAVGTLGFTLRVEEASFGVRELTPSSLPTGAASTVRIAGDSFSHDVAVTLRDAAGVVWPASVDRQNAGTLYATFDLTNTSEGGDADLIVDNGAGQEVTLENAIALGESIQTGFQATLDLPSLARPGRVVDLKIHYANTGNSDIAAPLLRLDSGNEQCQWQVSGNAQWVSGPIVQLLALSSEGNATTLRAGREETVTVKLRLPFEESDLPIQLTVVTDSDQAISWNALRSELFPAGLADADWLEVTNQAGATWADYLAALRSQHRRLDGLGWRTAGVQELFDEIADRATTLGDATVSGRVLDAETRQPITGTELILFSQTVDGIARLAQTDTNGEFTFRAVTNDRFFVKVGGSYTTETTSEVVVVRDENITDLMLLVSADADGPDAPADEEPVADSVETLTLDGVTHLIFAREGQLYHSHSTEAGWSAATAIPGAVGEDPQLTYSPGMFASRSEGLALLWSEGAGNEARIRANYARRSATSGWEWSVAEDFFDGAVASSAQDVTLDASGSLVTTWLMSDVVAKGDDSDIYYQATAAQTIDPVWPVNASASMLDAWTTDSPLSAARSLPVGSAYPVCSLAADENDCDGWSYSTEAKAPLFPPLWTTVPGFIPLIGNEQVKASAEVSSSIAADIAKAEARGTISGSLNVLDLVIGEIKGQAAEVYNLDRTSCAYVYAGGSGELEGSVTANVPIPGFWFDLPWDLGEVQLGVRLKGTLGAKYDVDGSWNGKFEAGGGLYGTAKIKNDLAKVDASGLMHVPISVTRSEFVFLTEEAYVEWKIKVEVAWWSFEFGDRYPESKTLAAALADFATSPYTVSLTDYAGSTNVYATTPMLADVASDLVNESSPILVNGPDGHVHAFWTRDSENRQQLLDNRILYSRWDGTGWSVPTEIPGTSGNARDLTGTTDSAGNLMLTWSRSDMSGWDVSSDAQGALEAYGNTEVYYAVMSSQGDWSTPTVLYDGTTRANNLTLERDASGGVWSAWSARNEMGGTLYAARWDGTGWTQPQQVFAGETGTTPQFAFPAGTPTLVWGRSTEDGSLTVPDGSLLYSEYEYGGWSYPRSLRLSELVPAAAPVPTAGALVAASGVIPSDYYQSPLGLFATLLGSVTVPSCVCDTEEDPVPPDPQAPDPPPPPGGGGGDSGEIPIYTSHTPEDKFGPAGYDAVATSEDQLKRFVRLEDTLHYRIEFWNEVDAVVPTQDALIVDTLDPDVFDLSTLEFTSVGFLDWEQPLAGGQSVDVRLDPRPELNCVVDVSSQFDPETGRIEWYFRCVDPLTGDYPADPMTGFLPAFNPDTGYEIGWIEFRVEPHSELETGDVVGNQAFVDFDCLWKLDPYENLPQHPAPKAGPWTNTIDTGAPASQVLALNPESPSSFRVEWSGQDDAGGSGIASYDIFVSIDDGPYELWIDETSHREALYTGSQDRTYAFYTIATDNVGHREAVPAEFDAITLVSGVSWQNPKNQFDVNANDVVTPEDILFVLDYLNTHADDLSLPAAPEVPPPFLDVNDDGWCTPEDILWVVNHLNILARSGGEGESFAPDVISVLVDSGISSRGNAALPTHRSGWHTVAERSTITQTSDFDQAVEHRSRTDDRFDLYEDFYELDDLLACIAHDVDDEWQKL